MIEESYGQPGIKIPPTDSYFFANDQNLAKQDVCLTSQVIGFKANQEKIHVEGWTFLPDTSVECSTKVKEGLKFMLSHFSEPLFPRNVSTTQTENRQKPVQDTRGSMKYYQDASWLDCRIAAFGIGQGNPDLIFIELDDRDFCSPIACKMGLTKTLKNIKQKLGGHPTVYRSGRGFHIMQPIHCPVNLDNVKEFANLTDSPNNKFLQFSERYLSGNKSDTGHHSAMRSCLIRVPHTFNSKCKEAGIDAEVKILQRWDGFRPDYRLLMGHFYADLVGRKNQESFSDDKAQSTTRHFMPGSDYGPVPWIEKLLQTPIGDFRKRSRDLILVPYLVIRRGMTDVDQITQLVMQWADKCAALYRLEPSRREYERRVRSRIYEVIRDRIPQMRLETLKEKNSGLYDKLRNK